MKMSLYPQDQTPSLTDSVLTYDAETESTKLALISTLINTFFDNMPEIDTDQIAADAVTDDKLDYPRWYQEIGRTTLSSGSATITVSSLPARDYLRLILFVSGYTAAAALYIQFNSDTGANYAWRGEVSGAADTTGASANYIQITSSTSVPGFHVIDIVNKSATEKGVMIFRNVSSAGAANAPSKQFIWGKWANTSSQISSITITHPSQNINSGSELIVLGHD